MPWHTVAQGEWLAQIARRYGFAKGDAIHDHPDNADLEKKRPAPSQLLPGDRLFIPDKDAKEVEVPSGKAHRFRVLLPKTKVKLIVHDEDDAPIASKPYKLTFDDRTYEGTSGSDGLIEAEIPIQTANSGQIEIDGHVLALRLGHLDPLAELSGVQGRLHNLGYDCGAIDGQESESLTETLKRFQKAMGLDPSGDLDDATRGKLEEKHGS